MISVLGWIVAGILLALLLGEVLLRLLSDWRHRTIDPGAYRDSPVPGLRFELVPRARFAHHYRERLIGGRPWSRESAINSLGMRDREYAPLPPPGVVRLVAVGNCCTFGEGVEEAESWPRRLEALLNEAPGRAGCPAFEVVNAGVPGYDLQQKLIHFRSKCLGLHPDVLLLTYTINDPQLWRDPYIDGEGYISCRGVPLGKRLRERWKRRWALAAWGGNLWSRVAGAQRLLPTYAPNSPEWIRARSLLREFQRFCRDHDVRLLVVILPATVRLSGRHPFLPIYGILEAFLEEEGIPFFNLYPAVQGWRDREVIVQSCDFHPGPRAYGAFAAAIHRELTAAPRFREWLRPRRPPGAASAAAPSP